MAVPGRVDAASLLLELDPPAWFLRHVAGVAEVAAFLAARAAAHGERIDRRLVEAAALLHDVDKLLPRSDPARRLPHGAGSAAWLARRGHPELGAAAAAHPVTRLLPGRHEAGSHPSAPEARIVAYADKRVGQRLEPMEARFASWRRRYPRGWTDRQRAVSRERADALEAEVCRLTGVSPDGVRRLRWVGRAMAAARGRASAPRLPAARRRRSA